MPYEIRLVDISGYYQACYFCNKNRCGGCVLEFSEEGKINDLFKAAGIESNVALFSSDRFSSGKEVQIEVVWHHSLDKNLYNVLATHQSWDSVEKEGTAKLTKENDAVLLSDCLSEFKITETLDEDNKWYCNRCKDHVIATKTM